MIVWSLGGKVGRLVDVLFDDRAWDVRHLVVVLDDALGGRAVLLPPSSVSFDMTTRQLRLHISVAEAAKASGLDADLPVCQQKDAELLRRFVSLGPWYGAATGGGDMLPLLFALDSTDEDEGDGGNPHLRSSREVMRYRIRAMGRIVGRVENLILDDQRWRIRFIEGVSGLWFRRRKLVFEVGQVDGISWADREVIVDPPFAPQWSVVRSGTGGTQRMRSDPPARSEG